MKENMDLSHDTSMRAAAFKAAAAQWATGVAVITSRDESNRPSGLTMSAVTSLSIDPLSFLICVDNRSATLRAIQSSGVFGINFLAQGQEAIAMRFASKGQDKFAEIAHSIDRNGLASIDGAVVYVSCAVGESFAGGDHTIIIGNVQEIEIRGASPLVYHAGAFRTLN